MKTLIDDFMPDSAEWLDWNPYSINGQWFQTWEGLGVEDGCIVFCSCDSDGDWDYCSDEEATDENFQKAHEQLVRETREAQKCYLEYCAETGHDPLGEFFIRYTRKKNEKYSATVTKWIGSSEHGMAVLSIHGAKSNLKGKTEIHPSEAPRHIAEFLGLVKVGDRYCMEDIKELSDVVHGKTYPHCKDSKNPVITFTVEREIKRREGIVREEVCKAARNALKGYE